MSLNWIKVTYHIIAIFSIFRYYNSRFDRPEQFNASYPDWMNDTSEMYDYVTPAVAHVAKVGTLLARSLYVLATGMEPPYDMAANETVVWKYQLNGP